MYQVNTKFNQKLSKLAFIFILFSLIYYLVEIFLPLVIQYIYYILDVHIYVGHVNSVHPKNLRKMDSAIWNYFVDQGKTPRDNDKTRVEISERTAYRRTSRGVGPTTLLINIIDYKK